MTAFRSLITSAYLRSPLTTFLLGILCGYLVISLWYQQITFNNIHVKPVSIENFQDQMISGSNPQNRNSSKDKGTTGSDIQNLTKDDHFSYESHKIKEISERSPRILCAVFSNPTTLSEKAVAVNNTWGKRCDILLFVCEKSHPGIPMLLVNVSKGRKFLSVKHRIAFDLIYRDYLNEAEWFFKADDDTYVIMENLRMYLKDKNTEDPAYYGHHFVSGNPRGYITGGSGYAMSREALKRLGERKEGVYSNKNTPGDDILLGATMEKLGVKQVNVIDSAGLTLFHFHQMSDYISGKYHDWYLRVEGHPPTQGIYNMTATPISFHYVTPLEMYATEYFLYRVCPLRKCPVKRRIH